MRFGKNNIGYNKINIIFLLYNLTGNIICGHQFNFVYRQLFHSDV